MKIIKIVLSFSSLLLLSLGLILSSASYAQSSNTGPSAPAGPELAIGSLGLNAPPPSGLEVRYMFSGVKNKPNVGRMATSVHCSNYDSGLSNVNVVVEFFNNDGTTTYSATNTIAPDKSWTFSTQATQMYGSNESVAGTGSAEIDQGSGRVLADSAEIACTSQVLDPSSSVQFITALTLFDGAGSCVSRHCHGGNGEVYLPAIFLDF